ncbi:MAG: putative dienelactone hydrolase [Alphaproteobacteria bacterium]|jgi:predicted dienelactone hydrolase
MQMKISSMNKYSNTKPKSITAVKLAFTWLCIALFSLCANAQQVLYSNNVHPDMMPQLSTKGALKVGVRTIEMTKEDYVDPFTGQIAPRSLTLEVWHPSVDKSLKKVTYENELRTGIKFSFLGDATRDVKIDASEDWPLVVLSHGYTGYRTIMYYLGEHLASHGYVVVGIDHTDGTNEDVDFARAPGGGFMSTLLNRSRDQQAVLDYFGDAANVKTVFGDSVSWTAKSAGVIGHSMGAYGAINTIGGCYDFPPALLAGFIQSEDEDRIKGMQTVLNSCSAGQYPKTMTGKDVQTDPRWKAMMAYAPWGGQHKVFSYDSLAGITVPSMIISGDLDDISIYAGVQDIYAQFASNDHFLLTYLNARHNIVTHPAPKEAWTAEIDYGHYYEPSWSSEQLSYNNNHFALAMMNCYLKEDASACEFLELSGNSNQVTSDGGLFGEPWKGFDKRFSTGMAFERGSAKKE